VILAAIFLLLFTPLVLLILHLVQRVKIIRSVYAYSWLFALGGSLLSWLLVLLARSRQVSLISLGNWRPVTYFPDAPKILVDPISWSFALAITTLVLAVILTVPIRQQGVNWHAWASSLALAGFGLLAVLAGNPLTLMLAWAAIDILEVSILLVQVGDSKVHVQTLAAFTARAGGLGLLLWADVAARSAGNGLSFTSDASASAVPARLSLFLLVAAGLRLGVLPLHLPYLQEPPLRRGLGASLRLAPAAASLVLLARTAYAGVPEAWLPALLVLVGLSALYGAFLWFTAEDEMSGRPFWILGMAAFVVASAACGVPEASLAWALACIFSGGLLFLSSVRHRNLLPLPIFGLLGFIGLPFTPAWGGMQFYTSLPSIFLIPVFTLAHALLISGYIRHAIRPEPMPENSQRWLWVLYPLGLALLPALQMVLFIGPMFFAGPAWQVFRQSGDTGLLTTPGNYAHLPVLTWTGSAIALGLAALFLWIKYRRRPNVELTPHLPPRLVSIIQKLFSLRWFYDLLGISLLLLVRFTRQLTAVLEGEGGILWVLVLLALLVALLLRGGQL
jgi:hypothetical protein